MRKNSLLALSLVVACLGSVGCSTIGDGFKSAAHSVGAYDYPVKFKPSRSVFSDATWYGLFQIKPAAELTMAEILALAEAQGKPADRERNMLRMLYLVDADHDGVVDKGESVDGAKNVVALVAEALGDMPIETGRTTTRK